MTCRECIQLVTEYLEATLPDGERVAFERHVAECADCEAYVESIRLTVVALGEAPAAPADPHVRAHLLAAYRARRG